MDLDKLEALATAATPGEWQVIIDKHLHHLGGNHIERRIATTWEHGQLRGPMPIVNSSVGISATKDGPPQHMTHIREHDAAFIAAFNPAVALELIAEIKRLRGDYDGVTNECADLRRMVTLMQNQKANALAALNLPALANHQGG